MENVIQLRSWRGFNPLIMSCENWVIIFAPTYWTQSISGFRKRDAGLTYCATATARLVGSVPERGVRVPRLMPFS